MFSVTDGGFLGLVDPHAYETFAHEDWTLESLFAHFTQQMSRRTLLLWGTDGSGGEWTVSFNQRSPGLRTIIGPINSTYGHLCLVSYADLTMAAQFADGILAAAQATNLVWKATPGAYSCAITQLHRYPANNPSAEADFDLTLEYPSAELAPWTGPAWFDLQSGHTVPDEAKQV
jgi:hypothetical protein